MGRAGEARDYRSFKDGQVGPAQQFAGFFQAQVAMERPGAAARPGLRAGAAKRGPGIFTFCFV